MGVRQCPRKCVSGVQTSEAAARDTFDQCAQTRTLDDVSSAT